MRSTIETQSYQSQTLRAVGGCTCYCAGSITAWSTSATGIIAGLWLLALIPTLDLPSLRRGHHSCWRPTGAVRSARRSRDVMGGCAMGGEARWHWFVIKLLFIPLLLQQFYRSDAGRQVLIGFLGSCIVLLFVSWLLWIWSGMPWPGTVKSIGRLYCAECNVHDLRPSDHAICI